MILAYFSNIESKLEEGIDGGGKKKTKKKCDSIKFFLVAIVSWEKWLICNLTY